MHLWELCNKHVGNRWHAQIRVQQAVQGKEGWDIDTGMRAITPCRAVPIPSRR
jgi:hypothetical protein